MNSPTYPKYQKMDLYPELIAIKVSIPIPSQVQLTSSEMQQAQQAKRKETNKSSLSVHLPSGQVSNISSRHYQLKERLENHFALIASTEAIPRNARGISSEAGTYSCVAKMLPKSHKGASTSKEKDKQVGIRNLHRSKNKHKGNVKALLFDVSSSRLKTSQRAYMAMPGTGFREGMGPALGFMGLGPGAGPRRMLPTWFAEFDLGRPICGGGAIWGPPP
jgi:hypothetical protein